METLVFILVIILFFMLVFLKEIRDEKTADKKLKTEIMQNWGSRKYRELSSTKMEQVSFFAKKYPGKEFVDDLTWNDLDMDEIYKNMAYTKSLAGDEYFYYILRNPSNDKEFLAEREEKIRAFYDRETAVSLQLSLTKMGRLKNVSMICYLEHLLGMDRGSNMRHYVADIFLLLSFGLIGINPGVGVFLLFFLILYSKFENFK